MFGDLTKRVVLAYKADTASAQADIKKLAMTQKDHAQVMKKDLEAQNTVLEGQIAQYAKYAATAAAVYGGIKVALDSMEFYYERNELREKAQGHSIEQLKEATRGLVSETELLKLAVAANNGVMKASESELLTVAKAMDVFADRNYDAAKVMSDFNEFLQTGKAKALKDYGLQITETRGSVEQFKEVMQQLTVVATDQAFIVNDSRDAWDQSKIALGDNVDSLREAAGAFMEHVSPVLTFFIDLANELIVAVKLAIEGWRLIFVAIKDMWDYVAGGLSMWGDSIRDAGEYLGIIKETDTRVSGMARSMAMVNEAIAIGVAAEKYKLSLMEQQQVIAITMAMGSGSPAKLMEAFKEMAVFRKAYAHTGDLELTDADMLDVDGMTPKGGGKRERPTFDLEMVDGDALRKKFAAQDAAITEAMNESHELFVAEWQKLGFAGQEHLLKAVEVAGDIRDEYAQFNVNRTQSVFRDMFGDPQEINLYAEGFNMLRDASVAAFQAMMTGSESAGAAFKRVIAAQMMALAANMFGKSVYHGVEALAYLITGSYGQAAASGVVAAKYASGALLLGGIASSLGGGGAAAGVSGGAGASGPATSSAGILPPPSEARGNSVTVVVGDDFADDSPRKRQQRAERMVNLGMRSSREVVFA